jgi:hypothetical protein
MTGCFISEDAYIGSGYDKTPMLFKKENGEWKFVKMIDDGITKEKKSSIGKDAFGGKTVFFDGPPAEVQMVENDTKHMNFINC